MAEIGDEAIRDVQHRMGDAGETRAQFSARFGQLKAPGQRRPVGRREGRVTAAQHLEPEERVADCAADPDLVAGLRAAPANLGAASNLAERGQRQHRRPRCRDRIATEQIDAEPRLVLGEPRGKARHPIVAEVRRQRCREQIMERPRAHRGEIGEVESQQLAGDQVGRILGQIMNALDDRIDGDDEPMSGPAINQRRVVREAKPARPGKRGKKPPDTAKLAETRLAHDRCRRFVRPSRRAPAERSSG